MTARTDDLDPPQPGVVRGIFNICSAWGLTDAESLHLLGATDIAELEAWREGDIASTTGETTMRMGHIIGIYGLLVAITGSHEECVRWMGAPNEGALLDGETPLRYLLGGGRERMARLRLVLRDVWEGVAP